MMHDLPEGQTQYDAKDAEAQSRAESANSMGGLEGFDKFWKRIENGYSLGAPVIDVKAIAREAWTVSQIEESYKCYSICQTIRMREHACAIEPSEAYDCEQALIEQRPLLKALLSL